MFGTFSKVQHKNGTQQPRVELAVSHNRQKSSITYNSLKDAITLSNTLIISKWLFLSNQQTI
jgi:hypothetical protein